MPPKNKVAPAAKDELRIEYLRLDELLRWPGNPKEHAEDAIQASIERFGFRDPLAIDEQSGRLIAGHGRLTVLERAHAAGSPAPKYVRVAEDGQWLIPVTRGGHFENEAEASAYLVAHNRLGELGGWNDDLLAEFVKPLDDVLKGLTGFDWSTLDSITAPQQGDFLNGLVAEFSPPAAPPMGNSIDPAASPTLAPPPAAAADEANPYMQVVYVVRKDERERVLRAVKEAREQFGVETAPEAFMRIVDAYLEARRAA